MGMPAIVEDRPRRLTGTQLGQAITLLSAQLNAGNHRLLRMIAEFDRSGHWREQGTMRSCAHWLVAHCGITLGAAREKVRVARQLEALPEVNEAFSEGGLSYSKVRAITRVATPENEGFMVHLAQQNSAGHLERLVSRYEPVPEPGLTGLLECGPEEVLAADGSGEAAADSPGAAAAAGTAEDAAEGDTAPAPDVEAMRELARELYWFQNEDGMWVLHAMLPPEQGQLVIKAVQAVARPLAEARQEAWQARQKARMQAVARKLLKRRGEKPDVVAAGEPGQADSCVGAAGGAPQADTAGGAEDSAGRGLQTEALSGNANPEAASGSSTSEALPDHLAYARAEEKISAA
tara:strand:+ start:19531 stop:20574 length:1044 start_codon:yes stop_codon:yes gene_type:complete